MSTTTDPAHPPAPADAGDSAPAAARAPLDGAAVAALALGIVGLAPVAVAAGAVAIGRTRGGQRRGRALAVAGLALAAVWTLAATAGVTAMLARPRPAAPRQSLRGTVYTLRTGQCADVSAGGVEGVRLRSCAQPHELEVYGVVPLPGHGWPGAAALAERARRDCVARLAGYLNPQLAATNLTELYVYPGRGAWSLGARAAVCEIRGTAGPLTGSVRASGG